MQVGFFFWPYTLELCEKLAERADRYGYAMIGIADTPGNAMDPWVSATLVARASRQTRVALCVTNLLTRHPAVSAAAVASLDHVSNGRAVLGIGAGHSGTRNVGLAKANAKELAEGVTFIKTLLKGNCEPRRRHRASAWVKRAPPVFLAASHPQPLQAPGAPPTAHSPISVGRRQHPRLGAQIREAPGRRPLAGELEIWQIAALDCNEDRNAPRQSAPCWLPGRLRDRRQESGNARRARALREPLWSCGGATARPGEADIRLVGSSACSTISRSGCRSAAIRTIAWRRRAPPRPPAPSG